MRYRVWMTSSVLALAILASPPLTQADNDTPTGVWKTIDDKTGNERSQVRIEEVNGLYEGKVESIVDQPGDDPAHLCKLCEGARKDQPIIGMTILWDLKKQGNDYTGGRILDPNNGKVYRCKMKLLDGGNKLEVRGYIGVSLLGRSQIWYRQQQ